MGGLLGFNLEILISSNQNQGFLYYNNYEVLNFIYLFDHFLYSLMLACSASPIDRGQPQLFILLIILFSLRQRRFYLVSLFGFTAVRAQEIALFLFSGAFIA
jgi:hypothetical protein